MAETERRVGVDRGHGEPPRLDATEERRVREIALQLACEVLRTGPRPAVKAGEHEAGQLVAMADAFTRWILRGEK